MINVRTVQGKVVHFVPSENRGKFGVGPDAAILKCLVQYDIQFVIHISYPR